jgi:hypothetical protein
MSNLLPCVRGILREKHISAVSIFQNIDRERQPRFPVFVF